MPKRLFKRAALLGTLVVLLVGLTVGVARATQREYACLRFYYNARQHWVMDLNSGVYMHDRRVTGSPLDIRRGAVSPDGTHIAYVNQAHTGRYSLYVQPNDLPPSQNAPSFCNDLMTCWRSQPPRTGAQRLQLSTPVIGMGWAPHSDLLGYVWLVRSGVIKAAANTPDGALIAEQAVVGDYLHFHGWAEAGRYVLFSTQDNLFRLTLHFWSPREDAIHSYTIGAVRGVPPYIAFAVAPQVGRAAAIVADASGVPSLYVISAEGGIERRETLPPHIDWRFNWSPTGEAVGIYHFDPPYWHFSIYTVAGETHRTIGGVTTGGDLMLRDGLRAFYWAADGESVAFVQRNRDGTGELMRYRLADRQLMPIREAVTAAYESHQRGQVALVRQVGARMALEVLDVASGAHTHLTTHEQFREVLWLRGAQALSYVAQEGGVFVIGHVDVISGTQQTLIRAERLYEMLRQEPATGWLTLWWRAQDGQTYLDGYMPNGDRTYRYRLLSGRGSNPPILFSAADGQAAIIMSADSLGREYLQIAVGDGERATMIDEDERRSTMALWSPDNEQVALLTSPLTNTGGSARQRLRVLSADGDLLRDFNAIKVGLLSAWTRCE